MDVPYSEIEFLGSQKAFHIWLLKNQNIKEELWIGFYKKNSSKNGITYKEALDEALCFGWIDGIRKSIDEESYTIRYTPRKANSKWSAVNIKRVNELIKLGLLAEAGLKEYKKIDLQKNLNYSYERDKAEFPSNLLNLFKRNKKAWNFFESQAAYYKRGATWWVISAKKEETKLRRLEKLISDSQNGKKLDMFISNKKNNK